MHPEKTRFRFAADRAVAKVVDGDAIVIDTVTGRYFSLEGTAEVAWSLLVGLRTRRRRSRPRSGERYDTGGADRARGCEQARR